MLDQIMDRRNIEKALLLVKRNQGAGGVDGMQTDVLLRQPEHPLPTTPSASDLSLF